MRQTPEKIRAPLACIPGGCMIALALADTKRDAEPSMPLEEAVKHFPPLYFLFGFHAVLLA
jgi:hypothetical protein